MRIVIRPAAAADIDEAFEWYENRREGLGREFLEAVDAGIASVNSNPVMYQVVHREIRRVLIHQFPFGIFYRIYGDVIVVIACMHGRRDPTRWSTRT